MGSAFTPTFNVSDASVGEPQLAAGATLKLATQQATTSGTSIDFTGIPSGTKQIIITYQDISKGAAANWLIQIGDSGGIEATGYVSGCWQGGSGDTLATDTTGFIISASSSAATNQTGTVILTLYDAATFSWTASGIGSRSDGAGQTSGGYKALSAELDRIRLTTTAGNTFDNGSINIAYK